MPRRMKVKCCECGEVWAPPEEHPACLFCPVCGVNKVMFNMDVLLSNPGEEGGDVLMVRKKEVFNARRGNGQAGSTWIIVHHVVE